MSTNKSNNYTKSIVVSALLIALAIIIPMYFGFLRVIIPPFFTATIASHVPQIIAMLISPTVAVATGIGSALGFFMAGYGPIVALRATSHIVWGFIGAKMIQNKNTFIKLVLITGIIHGLYEGLVIIPFLVAGNKFNMVAILVTAFGTFIHHLIDAAIAYSIARPLKLMRVKLK